VTFADAAPAQAGETWLAPRFNPAVTEQLFTGSSHTYRELLDL